MPRVYIEWDEGRTQDQKRKIAPLIVDAILAGDPKLRRDQVVVIFRQIAKTDRAKGGVFSTDA